MLLKFLSVAIVATAATSSFAYAQGRAPAELPPAGYVGQQYVDSKGCLFIRAGHGGQVNWVARIDRARKPICGQAPSASVMAAARRDLAAPAPVTTAPAAAPVATARVPTASYVPPPVTYGAPTPLTPRVAPAPVAAAPAPVHVQAPVAAPTAAAPGALVSRTAGCPAHAPVGRYYALRRGGDILICASEEHRLNGIRPVEVERIAAARGANKAAPAGGDLSSPPPGYKTAWRDDRLNPNRGPGTAHGHQQMLQVWTDTVPQELRHPAYAQPRQAAASSKSVPVARQAVPVAGARFVQVGSFGVPENASRAAARLQALGLPVQISRSQIKGKPVQVVRAGPFADEGGAVSALHAARGAGFGDAVLRR